MLAFAHMFLPFGESVSRILSDLPVSTETSQSLNCIEHILGCTEEVYSHHASSLPGRFSVSKRVRPRASHTFPYQSFPCQRIIERQEHFSYMILREDTALIVSELCALFLAVIAHVNDTLHMPSNPLSTERPRYSLQCSDNMFC